MAYFTSATVAMPCPRSCSKSSSRVKRFFRMACCCSFPSRTRMAGVPHTRARNRRWCSESWLMSSDRLKSVRMGMIPVNSGMPKSCMGTVARSEIIMVSTSSPGSSWPICRLPISRRPTTMRKYKITVRAKAVIIGSFPP